MKNQSLETRHRHLENLLPQNSYAWRMGVRFIYMYCICYTGTSDICPLSGYSTASHLTAVHILLLYVLMLSLEYSQCDLQCLYFFSMHGIIYQNTSQILHLSCKLKKLLPTKIVWYPPIPNYCVIFSTLASYLHLNLDKT